MAGCAGCLDLIYTGLAGKLEGLQMMTKVETGSHMGMSLVHCKKVCALVLQPISTGLHCSPCFGLVVDCALVFCLAHLPVGLFCGDCRLRVACCMKHAHAELACL